MPNIEFTATAPEGHQVTTNDTEILSKLADMGEQVQGISPDGTSVTLLGSQGPFTVPMAQILEKTGYKMEGFKPLNADTSMVKPSWRLAITELSDPDAQKAYLEGKLRAEGFENPTVTGHGRDWFMFNPKSNQWSALTNKPTWDMSDLAEGGADVAKGIGSALGSTAGAVLGGGVGSIPGMAIGGAAGAAGADALIKGGLAAVDPEYRQNITAGRVARDLAMEGAAGGIPAAGMGAAMKFGGPLLRTMASSGPLTSMGRGAGEIANAAGGLTAGAAKMIGKSPLATDVAASLVSPTYGAAQLAGLALQAPKAAAVHIPEMVAKSAESNLAKTMFGEGAANRVAEGARGLTTPRPGTGLSGKIGQLNRFMRGQSEESSARNAIGNLAEQWGAPEASPMVQRMAAQSAYGGELPLEAADVAAQKSRGVMGEKVGETFDKLARLGQLAEEGPRAVAKGVLKTAEGAGRAAQIGGKAMAQTSQALQPFENMLYGQSGLRGLANLAEDGYPKNKLKNFKSPPRIMAEN